MPTDVTFQSVGLRATVPGIYINDIIRPARPPYERTKVVIPGRNGSYDFGNNRREDFDITVEVTITGDTSAEVQTRVALLNGWLDGKGTLVFSDALAVEYEAAVYDEVRLAGDASGRWVRGLIVFECDGSDTT